MFKYYGKHNRWLRLRWIAFDGVRRCKCVSISQDDKDPIQYLENLTVGLTPAMYGVNALCDVPVMTSGCGPVGEVFMKPGNGYKDTSVRNKRIFTQYEFIYFFNH